MHYMCNINVIYIEPQSLNNYNQTIWKIYKPNNDIRAEGSEWMTAQS